MVHACEAIARAPCGDSGKCAYGLSLTRRAALRATLFLSIRAGARVVKLREGLFGLSFIAIYVTLDWLSFIHPMAGFNITPRYRRSAARLCSYPAGERRQGLINFSISWRKPDVTKSCQGKSSGRLFG